MLSLKLKEAQQAVEENPGDVQLKLSLAAIEKVQPEKIPFEVLDFNMGERWMPRKLLRTICDGSF